MYRLAVSMLIIGTMNLNPFFPVPMGEHRLGNLKVLSCYNNCLNCPLSLLQAKAIPFDGGLMALVYAQSTLG
jgi:hypothetical protein